jgi:hypothetical protein
MHVTYLAVFGSNVIALDGFIRIARNLELEAATLYRYVARFSGSNRSKLSSSQRQSC